MSLFGTRRLKSNSHYQCNNIYHECFEYDIKEFISLSKYEMSTSKHSYTPIDKLKELGPKM